MNTKTTYLKLMIAGLSFTCILSTLSYAQNVGINGTGNAPDASAMLDVDATNKGLLVPRIALTSTTDAITVAAPATSLLVYNTATAGGVVPGYYYNSGTTVSPTWTSFSSKPKFQIPIGAWGRPVYSNNYWNVIGGFVSGLSSSVLPVTLYGNGASPGAADNTRGVADAFFVANSAVSFNGATCWFNTASGSFNGVITFYLYKKSGQTSGTSLISSFTQISSAVAVTFSPGTNVYRVNFPATGEALMPGDLLFMFVKIGANDNSPNLYLTGSVEFSY